MTEELKSPRPSIGDEVVRWRWAERLRPVIATHLKGIDRGTDDDLAGAMALLPLVMAEPWGLPPELATNRLRAAGWGEDPGLLELVKSMNREWEEAYRDVLSAWIQANGIAPTFKIGDAVVITERVGDGSFQDFEGEIVKLYPETALYVVLVPEMNHVREGEGVRGLIRPFEACRAREVTP